MTKGSHHSFALDDAGVVGIIMFLKMLCPRDVPLLLLIALWIRFMDATSSSCVLVESFILTKTMPLQTTIHQKSRATLLSSSPNNQVEVENHHRTFRIRPFDITRDKESLETICRHVFNGEDYLPSLSSTLADDPTCRFMSLVHVKNDGRDETLLAVANLRSLTSEDDESKKEEGSSTSGCSQQRWWLEAVRTCPNHRNMGLASYLLSSMFDDIKTINKAGNEYHAVEISTCTIQSNKSMIRIFEEKLGMTYRTTLHTTQIDELRKLPGWAASASASVLSSKSRTPSTTTRIQPQSILQALEIEHMITKEAKAKKWDMVKDEDEMKCIVQSMMKQNHHHKDQDEVEEKGTLYFPGLFEVISMNTLRDSLQNGRMWKTTTTTTDTTTMANTAIFALLQDSRIDSLQSNWILSIITTTEIDLQSAIWFVCNHSERKRKSLAGENHEQESIQLLEDGEVRFAVAFIDASRGSGGVNSGGGDTDNSNRSKLPLLEDSYFCQALKLRKDQAVLYSIRF